MAQSSIKNGFHIYQPRNSKASAYYKCVENHFEELEQAWDDIFKIELRDYGCPILKFSHILIFPVYFSNNYSSQPMSIFLSE